MQHDQDAQDLIQEACNPRISATERSLDLIFPAKSETRRALLPAIDGGLSLVGDRLAAGISPFQSDHNLPSRSIRITASDPENSLLFKY
jgi:hypothetical protein